MSILKFSLVLTDIFLSMHVAMSLDIADVHLSLNSSGSTVFKRAGSKDIDRSETRAVVERLSMSLPIYKDTKLIVEKYIK